MKLPARASRLTLLSFTFVCAAAAGLAQAQTVDEIIARNLQAKGGPEKWQSIQSVKMTGKMTAQGAEMPLTVYAMRPNYNRQEITMPAGKAVQAFDGKTAWMMNPMMGIGTPQPIPGPAAEMARNSADFDGALINYKEKGSTVELVGRETLEGRDVYHLRVTAKGGTPQHYFLDAETGIELKMTAEVDPGNGQKQTISTVMSDYKPVNGVMIPHTVTQMADGKTLLRWTITSVEFNAVKDPAIFSMPRQ